MADFVLEDRDLWVYGSFDARNRERIRKLVTPELIAEHQRDPRGLHTDDLDRVLAYFRRGPIFGKYIIVTDRPFENYRIGVLNGERGRRITVLDGEFATEREVMHAIFLLRIADLEVSV